MWNINASLFWTLDEFGGFILPTFFPLVLVEYRGIFDTGMGCTFDDPGIFIDGGPNRRGNSITRGSLLAGGCGCFRGFLKSTAVFWRNWSLKQKFYGETLVKLFCCEFMLIIVCTIILFIFSVTLGKLTHFATDSAPHQPADPWASASSKSTGQWRDVGGRVQHPAPGCPLRECNGLLVIWVVTSCKKLTRTCIITLRNYI